MPEFSQTFANKLVGVPWTIKTTSSHDSSSRETCYFFKFVSDTTENTCCFMITDTINVWAEVLDSKYTSHRARHAHSARGSSKRGFALPYHDVDEEADWRRGVVKSLGEMHENAMEGGIEFEVKNSEVADLSVYLSDTLKDFHWRWDVMSVGRMSGEILSKQLLMPVVTLATVMSNLNQSIEDTPEATLKTVTERKASTAKVMPAHHLRGFLSRPAVQTTLKCIAQVDGAPSISGYEPPASKLVSTPSIDMADPPDESNFRGSGSNSRLPASSSGDSLPRFDAFGSSRKGKGRDDTDDEDEGSARKMRRGATPRRSDVRASLSNETPTARRTSFPRSRLDPDSTATEAETTRQTHGNNSYMDEDDLGPPAAASSQPPPAPSPGIASPRPAVRPSPRDKIAREASRSPVDSSDVFGGAETQTQASSDDSDREAELARRVRAAGTIGSAAVRTPAGGGLGSRMIRKKF